MTTERPTTLQPEMPATRWGDPTHETGLPDGVRDLYASAGWGWKAVGPLTGVTLQAVYHDYRSDRATRSYGDEIDLLASAKLGKVTASARYAHYDADTFATDTDKFWLQLDWML